MSIDTHKLRLRAFDGFWQDAKKKQPLFQVLKGGRGSGKSEQIAFRLIIDIIRYPITALCIRKVGNTIKESCYEQIKEVIYRLGIEQLFKFKINPLEIQYIGYDQRSKKQRDNKIIFRGADDPSKIKSIKISKYPIARLWIEELAEFKTEDEVSTIVNSVLRSELNGELFYKIYYSYNPPKRRQSWVNQKYESVILPANTKVYHSTYLDNPYISGAFIEEAEIVKQTRPLKYKWEYLGEPIGAGIVPFDNLEFRQITQGEIMNFDNIRQGLDWGYATDPLHMTRLQYDKKKRKIYVFGEIHQVKLSTRRLIELIRQKGWTDTPIISDVEARSVAEVREAGIKISEAKKGAGSVEYGEKWLDDLDAIVIDPVRCPNTAREFESIDYMTDRYGEPLPRLEDKDNHSIDAVRYALNNDMRSKIYSFE